MAKYAILTDSASNLPDEYINSGIVYVAPITVNYQNESFLDGIEITTEQAIVRLTEEVPKTSLPPLELIYEQLRKIIADGYDSVMVTSVSSNLSGTFGALKLATEEFPQLKCAYVDTLNIGLGSGMTGAYAAQLALDGLSLEQAEPLAQGIVGNTKAFFCFPTLEYLRKGGRIGLIAGFVGAALGLRPVITCNDDGVYDTVSKARGWQRAIDTALDQAVVFAGNSERYNLAVEHTATHEEALAFLETAKKRLPNYNKVFIRTLMPSMAVHAGRGFMGIGVQRLPNTAQNPLTAK